MVGYKELWLEHGLMGRYCLSVNSLGVTLTSVWEYSNILQENEQATKDFGTNAKPLVFIVKTMA